ncbi:MAG: gamma-glutamylcyclotransferase [Pseudomonadota bacterium]|nr:gamma-glutamylcyclotransferase [Pseudomonadota bacterium]
MSDLWIFAYGSLMWRPGFAFEEVQPARISGAHRGLCVYSFVHRGTPGRPGLVLGLDAGGRCDGVAYRVSAMNRKGVIAYLRAREQVTRVYREAERSIELPAQEHRKVRSVCYMVDRTHRQYAGRLPLDVQAGLVRDARGQSGRNIDYVVNTIRHLREQGIHDAGMERLLVRLGRGARARCGPIEGK